MTQKLMSVGELADRVDDVLARAGDPEGAHSAEDDLMREWILLRADDDERREFHRMFEADFPRWCA